MTAGPIENALEEALSFIECADDYIARYYGNETDNELLYVQGEALKDLAKEFCDKVKEVKQHFYYREAKN